MSGRHAFRSRILLAAAVTALLAASYLMSARPAGAAGWGIDRAAEMPDLTQTDRRLGLENGGEAHCVPVSATNAILWLGRTGYRHLLPVRGDEMEQAAEIAARLASPAYMNTDPRKGTSHVGFAQGLSRYLADHGVRGRVIYQGRWPMPARYGGAAGAVPTFDFVTDSFRGDSAVWLSVGFYAYDRAHNELTRLSGHFLTLVGYGLDARGNPDRDVLIVHNSWPNRNGRAAQQEYLRVERMLSGWFLAGEDGARAGEARDHMRVVGGLPLPRGADVAIIDAALALRL